MRGALSGVSILPRVLQEAQYLLILQFRIPDIDIVSDTSNMPQRDINMPPSRHKQMDHTNHGPWYPPHLGLWNQNVRSLC